MSILFVCLFHNRYISLYWGPFIPNLCEHFIEVVDTIFGSYLRNGLVNLPIFVDKLSIFNLIRYYRRSLIKTQEKVFQSSHFWAETTRETSAVSSCFFRDQLGTSHFFSFVWESRTDKSSFQYFCSVDWRWNNTNKSSFLGGKLSHHLVNQDTRNENEKKQVDSTIYVTTLPIS